MSESLRSILSRAVCRDADPDLFIPSRETLYEEEAAEEEVVGYLIEQYCSVCPVRNECLAYALEVAPHGIWGGTTSRGRRRIKSAERKVGKA